MTPSDLFLGLKANTCVVKQVRMGKIYSIADGNRAQAVKKEQQGGVHIMEEVSGLMTLGAQRKADLSGPTVRDQERDQKLTKFAKIKLQFCSKFSKFC